MLNKKQKYLQIALNSTLEEAKSIINQLPVDERIIIEVGTPLIKKYGIQAIKTIKSWWTSKVSLSSKNFYPYVVANLKTMDRGATEVEITYSGGADAAIALGTAPIETLNIFIEKCRELKIDAMIDMINIDFSLEILRNLKNLPDVVILHRGVDEEQFNPESEIPYHEIHRIKENYDILVSVAGGDTIQEVQRAIFNDADIVIVWKHFYESSSEVAKLAQEFLNEIK
jgi:bifunctional enzyme Fae/Hps